MFPPSKSIIQEVREAIGAPSLARNIRGQVRVGLGCLPLLWQRLLACDFADHAINIILLEDCRLLQYTLEGINAIRNYLCGMNSLDDVSNKVAIVYDTHRERNILSNSNRIANECITLRDSGQLLVLVQRCCCQRDYENEQLVFRTRYQPDAAEIAKEACATVYRHNRGYHKNSTGTVENNHMQAKSGRNSEAEAEYQRDHLMKFVVERLSNSENANEI